MITLHLSPGRHMVYLEHVPEYGTIALSPEQAFSLLRQLEERRLDIFNMVLDGRAEKYDCADCGNMHQVGMICPSLKEKLNHGQN